MSRQRKYLLLRDIQTPAQVFEAAIAAISPAPVLWLPLRETSGTTALNSGSAGNALDGAWTAGAGAVGQTGILGANEAYLYDALASRIAVPASTLLNNLTNFTWAVLVNFASAGEAGNANIMAEGGNRNLSIASATPFRLSWGVWHTSDFSTVTTAAGAQNLPASTWGWIFATYTASDKRCRLYLGRSGAVTEMTYSTNTISVNALSNGSGVQNIGNNAASSRTVDGLVDEALIFSSVLTADQMLSLVLASGV